MSVSSLREQLGLVPQDTILFDETMLYNLRYGDLRATEEEVRWSRRGGRARRDGEQDAGWLPLAWASVASLSQAARGSASRSRVPS